jgi:hypothetical protein
MIACYGVRAPHDPRPDVALYAIGPGERRAFLCRECRDALVEVGVPCTLVIPVTRARERRYAGGRRSRDNQLGRLGHDRRAP